MSDSPDISQRMGRLAVVGIWAATCAAMLYFYRGLASGIDFGDPDDALRLVQVRELLAGQSWFDLVLHRVAPPEGVLMHWSRFVDLPIAALIGALRPLFGQPVAERLALAIVPLTMLLGLFLMLYRLRVPLGLSRGASLLACAMLATSLSILIQFTPGRIDHHGWQILLGTVALYGLILPGEGNARGALIAGLAMAGWMQISIEGLPYAVAFGGIIALRGLLLRQSLRGLILYMLALTGASALLMPLGHGGIASFAAACDAMSPSYLLPLAACTTALILGTALLRPRTAPRQILVLGLSGLAGAGAFFLFSRSCLAGPFDTLAPLVYKLWYMGVKEGRPITEQSPKMAAFIVMPCLFGLIGTVAAWRAQKDPDKRQAWLALIGAQIASAVLAMDVLRAMGFAHLAALPGNAWLLAWLFSRTLSLRTAPLRVIASATCVVATPFGGVSASAALIADEAKAKESPAIETARLRCATAGSLAGLNEAPPGLILAPVDVSSHILANSHHEVVATGHHRNIKGMNAVMRALIAPPAEAERIIRATGANYVAYCPYQEEVERYIEVAPQGLMARIDAKRLPAWLVPVKLPPYSTIRLYQILPSSPSSSRASRI